MQGRMDWRVVLCLAATSMALTACSEPEEHTAAPPVTLGGGGSGGEIARSGGGGSGEGAALNCGGAGGQGGCVPVEHAVCGNGVAEGSEQCDGSDIREVTCSDLFLGDGGHYSILCSADCTYITSDCPVHEECFNGMDEDHDGLVDCADPHCSTTCSEDVCSGEQEYVPGPFEDKGFVSSNTSGPQDLDELASCAPEGAAGTVAYSFKPAMTGNLTLALSASSGATVSVRTLCGDQGTELACVDCPEEGNSCPGLVVPVEKNQTISVLVSARSVVTEGPFSLVAQIVGEGCGNGICEDTEGCDDNNTANGDGCSSTCISENDDAEPNETPETATASKQVLRGVISDSNDVDVFSVSVDTIPPTLALLVNTELSDICQQGSGGLSVDILSPEGAVLATTDIEEFDIGEVEAQGDNPGTYFFRIHATETATNASYDVLVE